MFQQCTEYLHRTSKISSFFFVGCFVVVVVVVVFVVVVSMDGEEEQQGGWGGGIEYFVSLKTGEKFHLSHQNLDEAAFVSINRAPSIVLFCIFFLLPLLVVVVLIERLRTAAIDSNPAFFFVCFEIKKKNFPFVSINESSFFFFVLKFFFFLVNTENGERGTRNGAGRGER